MADNIPNTGNPTDSSLVCACTILRKASRIVARFYEKRLSGTGFTATQYSILKRLYDNNPLPLIRLAEQLVMERTSLYRSIKPLVDNELIETLPSKRDKRIIEVKLTKKGRSAVEKTYSYWKNIQDDFLDIFGEKNWENLSFELDTLIKKMGEN